MSHRSLKLCLFFFNLFSFCFSDSIISIVPFSSLLIFYSDICLWIPLVNFPFQVLYFSTLKFLFVLYLFTNISILFIHCFCDYPPFSLALQTSQNSCFKVFSFISPASGLSQRWFLLILFLVHTFLFLCMCCDFFVENFGNQISPGFAILLFNCCRMSLCQDQPEV